MKNEFFTREFVLKSTNSQAEKGAWFFYAESYKKVPEKGYGRNNIGSYKVCMYYIFCVDMYLSVLLRNDLVCFRPGAGIKRSLAPAERIQSGNL